MKKNAIKHMDPPKRGFGSFFKKLHIIPFLLCVILAVLFWLVTANLNKAQTTDAGDTDGTKVEETTTGDTTRTTDASGTTIIYAP